MPRWFFEIEHNLNIWNPGRMSNYYLNRARFSNCFFIIGSQYSGSSIIASYGDFWPKSASGLLSQFMNAWSWLTISALCVQPPEKYNPSNMFKSLDTWSACLIPVAPDWLCIFQSIWRTRSQIPNVSTLDNNSSTADATSSSVKVSVSVIIMQH